MDYMKIWHDTGTLNKGIVIFLALMSVVSLSVAVTKWLRFRKMATATRAFAPVFSQALENDNIPEALAAADQYPGSHVARVLGESLREVAPLLEDPRAAGAAIVSCERSVKREQILLANDLKSGMGCSPPSAPPRPSWGCWAPPWASCAPSWGWARAAPASRRCRAASPRR